MEMFFNKIIHLGFFHPVCKSLRKKIVLNFKSEHGNWKLTPNHQASIYFFAEQFSCLTVQLDSSNYVSNPQIHNYNQNAYAVTEQIITSTWFCCLLDIHL